METNKFEVVYKANVKNTQNEVKSSGEKPDDVEGYAMWYVNHQPNPKEMSVNFGYKHDFNGVGLFVFKHEGKWRL